MSDKNLVFLLTEYEQKRRKAEMDLEYRKEKLYKKIPRLQEIETEITKIAINKAKSAFLNNISIKELEEEFETIKKEKEDILRREKIDSSFFNPSYECKLCKDTGYILDTTNKTIMCSCLKQSLLNNLYNKSNLSNID